MVVVTVSQTEVSAALQIVYSISYSPGGVPPAISTVPSVGSIVIPG